jgi:hypothetical protein
MFLVINIRPDEGRMLNSIDDFSSIPSSRKMENASGKEFGMDDDQILQAHASNLQGWYENGYDPRLLESTLAFSLLKKLSRLDNKAKRVLQTEIYNRTVEGTSNTRLAILETVWDMIDDKTISVMLSDPDPMVWKRVILHPNIDKNRLIDFVAVMDYQDRIDISESINVDMVLRKIYEFSYNNNETDVLFNVASNDASSQELLMDLYKSSKNMSEDGYYILHAIASNPNIPLDVMNEISSIGSCTIIESLASNESIGKSRKASINIATGNCVEAKRILASNKRSHEDALELLIKNEDLVTSKLAMQVLERRKRKRRW